MAKRLQCSFCGKHQDQLKWLVASASGVHICDGCLALGQRAIDDVKCSFCGLPHGRLKKLLAGPKVFICDCCVDLGRDVIGGGASKENTRTSFEFFDRSPSSDRACSFCGKGAASRQLFGNKDTTMCQECLGVADELLRAS